MKKLLAFIMAITICVSTMPISTFAITTNNNNPIEVVGDLDKDGEITDWDGVLLARHLAGWGGIFDSMVMDVDGDGEITDWDGVIFDRMLAGWSVNTEVGKKLAFNITYLNTKGAAHSNPATLQYGNTETALSEISVTHYAFDGWYEGNQKFTSIPANYNKDLSLTAKWIPIEYSITYDNTKGAVNTNPTHYNIENSTIALSNINVEGYTFDGWYNEGTRITSIPSGTNGNIVLTAKWTPCEYNIIYNNTKGATNINATGFNTDSETIILSDLHKEGYAFDGWYQNDVKVTEITKGTIGDVELIAKWTPITYSATFVAEGNVVATRYFTIEDSVLNNVPNVPSKIGYTGVWQSYTIIASNITIYADYALNEYTITYSNTKGAENANPLTYSITTGAFTLSHLQCEGYTFDGWYKGNTKIDKIENGSYGNVTLTAKWTPIEYSITYNNTKGAINTNPTHYNIENSTIALSNINVEGYTFDGWYNEGTRITSIPSGTNGNIVLTAKWTPCEYNIIYNNTKDAINSNATGFNTDSETIILSDLQKDGYVFEGWFQNGFKVTQITKGTIGDVVLTAKWTIITYTATFVSDNSIVDIRYFTVEDPEIANLPTVPQKEHYIGKWSAYSISSKDLTINAEYTAKEYTITYINTHGGTNSNPTKYTIESDTITLNAPIAEGYRFVGWYIGDEIIEKVDNGTTGNIELIAKWTLINYIATFKYENTVIATRNFTVEDSEITDVPDVPTTKYYDVSWESYKILPQDITINAVNTLKSGYSYITFDKGDGASSQGIVIAKLGDSMPKLNYSLVAPAGYKFLGYYDGITDYATMYYNSNLEGTRDWDKRGSNVTLYARYEKQEWYHDYSLWVVNISTSSTRYHFSSFCKDYNLQLLSTGTTTVTIKNSNGKTVFQKEYSKSSSIQTTKLTLEIGEIYYITTTSTQTGGYYRILNDIGNYVSNCPYDSYFCNIVYSNTKSAQNNNPEKICAYCLNEQEWISGEPYILKDIKKSGYMFDGWFLNGKKVTQITINDFEYYTDGYNVDYRDIELVAKMTPITYTATFYVDGNIVGITNFTMEDEEILNVPATPVREHYTGKWEYTIVPNDIIITEFSYIPTEYTISYENTDSASHFNPSTYNIENSVILKDAYREHYTFEGWYLNGQLVTEIPTGTTGDIVIVAKWKPITYTITYSSCFGSAPSATTYTVENQSIILPRMSDIEGYYFYGWFIGNSEVTSFDTKTGKDITLIAKWAPKQAIGSDDVNYTVNKSSPYVSWSYIHKEVTCNWDASSRTYVIEIQLDVVGLNQDGISGGYVYGELYIDGEYAGTWTYPGSFEHHNNIISPIKYLVS